MIYTIYGIKHTWTISRLYCSNSLGLRPLLATECRHTSLSTCNDDDVCIGIYVDVWSWPFLLVLSCLLQHQCRNSFSHCYHLPLILLYKYVGQVIHTYTCICTCTHSSVHTDTQTHSYINTLCLAKIPSINSLLSVISLTNSVNAVSTGEFSKQYTQLQQIAS